MQASKALFALLIVVLSLISAESSFARPTDGRVYSLRQGISWQRAQTWHWQSLAGLSRTRTAYTERGETSIPYLRWVARLWNNRREAAYRSYKTQRHTAGGLRSYAGYCAAWLIDHEDPSWDPHRYNSAGSGAYGLPQALPGSKMSSAGADWRDNPYTQIRWMHSYTRARYGGDCQAKAYWETHGSY